MTKIPHLGLCLAVVLGACSDGSSSSSTAKRSGSSAAPTARLRLEGAAGVTGALTDTSVRCNFPSLDGSTIAVLGQPPDSSLLARIALQADTVKVVLSAGSDTAYRERAFEGAGVSSFDAADGALVDSALTETATSSGAPTGSLGAVTAIKGSVRCGDQTAGTSSVTITGETAEGSLAAARLDPVRVECDATPGGDEVVASGLTNVGSTRALVAIGLTSDGAVTVDETLPSGSRRYAAGGTSTVTSHGAHVRADVIESGAASPQRLHVEGDMTCGTHASG